MEDISNTLHKVAQGFSELSREVASSDAEVYNCPRCRDTGYLLVGERAVPCVCRRAASLREKKLRSGLTLRLQQMDFDSFDLRFYPEHQKDAEGKSYRRIASDALACSRELARQVAVGHSCRGLLLRGGVGCGKTHLAAAATNAVIEQGGDALFLVVPEFLDQLRFSYRRENEGLDEVNIITRAYNVPLLVLDDLGAHNYSEWVCNKLFTIINHRYNRDLPCIVTTNLTLEELDAKIGDRTASRLVELCRSFHILVSDKWPDHRLGSLV